MLRHSLARHLQDGTLALTTDAGEEVEFPIVSGQWTVITAGADGSPERIDRNWTAEEAEDFLRDYRNWFYLGWLYRIPGFRRWAPARLRQHVRMRAPLSGGTAVRDLPLRGVRVEGKIHGLAINSPPPQRYAGATASS